MDRVEAPAGHDVMTAEVVTLADGEAIARHMAGWLLAQAQAKSEGPFRIALSGGSTPHRLFEIMATPEIAEQFPWDRAQFFFGDERHVSYDDPDSNYRMSREALFDHISIPAENLHPIPTAGTPADDAERYEAELKAAYGHDDLKAGNPLFDIVLLGMGPDGHTASLFPGQPVLEEKDHWVGTATPGYVPHTRVTLTYPAIHSSRYVVFLLSGAEKAEMFQRVRRGDDASLPASHVTTEGELVFIVDKPVLSGLD